MALLVADREMRMDFHHPSAATHTTVAFLFGCALKIAVIRCRMHALALSTENLDQRRLSPWLHQMVAGSDRLYEKL